MKRITVSLPDELVDQIKRDAGEGQVSSYVATALADYQQRESLDDLLAVWRSETPLPASVRKQVDAELDGIGLTANSAKSGRIAG